MGELSPFDGSRRLRACVERWPEAWTCGYDPRCCRFPKSCSATVYDLDRVDESDLEPVEMTSTAPPQAGERSDIRKGTKEYETALLRQRYHDLRAAVIRDGLPNLVARIEAAALRTQCDE